MEKIVSKISQIRRHLESLLDNDFEPGSRREKDHLKTKFEISRDISLIRGISAGLPEDHLDRIVILFSRMSLFFDAGVMLENQDGRWTAQATFEKGHAEALKKQSKTAIKLPHVEVLSVLRTPASSLLRKLQLSFLDPEDHLQCLLIKISGDFSFLLLSALPDLWLKEHIAQIKSALQNGIAD